MDTIGSKRDELLKPLIAQGLTNDEAVKFLGLFEPVIQNIFQKRVMSALSEEEIKKFDLLGGTLGEMEAVAKLEEMYEKKSGKGFLDLRFEVTQELVGVLVGAIKKTKKSLGKLTQMSKVESEELKDALEKNDKERIVDVLARLG